jgi:hypothetical protein
MDLRWVVLATGLVLSILDCSQTRAQPMERPALNIGDSWTYEFHEFGTAASPGNFHYVDTFTVSEVFPKQYAMSKLSTAERDGESKQSTYRITRDLNGYARQNAALPWQEAVWLVWPLEPGQKWKFDVPIAAGIQVWEAHVEGWEDVEVPAGKFRAVRIVHDLIVSPNPLVGWKVTQWYAPTVKTFVKKTDHGWYEASITIKRDLRELRSFKLQ